MKLEIGCGEHPDLSYDLHMDIRPLPHVEMIGDCATIPFPDDTFSEIRANDVLEHFSHRQVRAVLGEWLRVLQPGGMLHVQVPNLRAMALRYLSGEQETYVVPNDALSWSYWIGGGQDYPGEAWRYNAHYTFFDFASWVRLAREVGFDLMRCESDGGTNLMVEVRKR